MAPTNYKISFCVVCMNRLHQLKQTLLQNIRDNADYEELEFIILDYNSKDGMEEWIKENVNEYILSGRVTYYKTIEPDSWNPSHSKNLAFKLGTGDIVCSIWADYYTGQRFAHYINDAYKKDNNIVLTPIDFYQTKKNYAPSKDVLGKVCVKKSDFLKINGFDERMNKHGFEDYDFINRLEMINVKRVLIEDFTFLKFIPHDDDERYLLPVDNLKGLYVSYNSPSISEILFLYRDKRFEKGTLIDNFTMGAESYKYSYKSKNSRFEYALTDSGWETGMWEEIKGKAIRFSTVHNNEFFYRQTDQNDLFDHKSKQYFYYISNQEIINGILVFSHFYYTRSIMEKNLKNEKVIVNPYYFGKAIVFKNFKSEYPIAV